MKTTLRAAVTLTCGLLVPLACGKSEEATLPALACAADSDCRLRVTGCCECGGSTASWDLIAIAHDGEADYQALVCDPEQACDECAPVYPVDVEAYCATDGHCATRRVTD
jgi:hypothetical protein